MCGPPGWGRAAGQSEPVEIEIRLVVVVLSVGGDGDAVLVEPAQHPLVDGVVMFPVQQGEGALLQVHDAQTGDPQPLGLGIVVGKQDLGAGGVGEKRAVRLGKREALHGGDPAGDQVQYRHPAVLRHIDSPPAAEEELEAVGLFLMFLIDRQLREGADKLAAVRLPCPDVIARPIRAGEGQQDQGAVIGEVGAEDLQTGERVEVGGGLGLPVAVEPAHPVAGENGGGEIVCPQDPGEGGRLSPSWYRPAGR